MQKQLKGTIETNHSKSISIRADDGDWYEFKNSELFNIGDRVLFDPIDSKHAFDMALLGGPIPCENVKLIK